MRALVIDDSKEMRTIQKSILLEMNMAASEAENGVEALELLKNDSDYDLIVLDIDMPEMDGIETLKEIKKEASSKDIPVLDVFDSWR